MNKRIKHIIALSIVLVGMIALSSCNKEYPKMEVIKDCTGSYLRTKAGLDYYVCNFAILDSYATGTKIRVKYDVLNTCFGLIENPTCQMAHTFEDVIDVLEIKD